MTKRLAGLTPAQEREKKKKRDLALAGQGQTTPPVGTGGPAGQGTGPGGPGPAPGGPGGMPGGPPMPGQVSEPSGTNAPGGPPGGMGMGTLTGGSLPQGALRYGPNQGGIPQDDPSWYGSGGKQGGSGSASTPDRPDRQGGFQPGGGMQGGMETPKIGGAMGTLTGDMNPGGMMQAPGGGDMPSQTKMQMEMPDMPKGPTGSNAANRGMMMQNMESAQAQAGTGMDQPMMPPLGGPGMEGQQTGGSGMQMPGMPQGEGQGMPGGMDQGMPGQQGMPGEGTLTGGQQGVTGQAGAGQQQVGTGGADGPKPGNRREYDQWGGWRDFDASGTEVSRGVGHGKGTGSANDPHRPDRKAGESKEEYDNKRYGGTLEERQKKLRASEEQRAKQAVTEKPKWMQKQEKTQARRKAAHDWKKSGFDQLRRDVESGVKQWDASTGTYRSGVDAKQQRAKADDHISKLENVLAALRKGEDISSPDAVKRLGISTSAILAHKGETTAGVDLSTQEVVQRLIAGAKRKLKPGNIPKMGEYSQAGEAGVSGALPGQAGAGTLTGGTAGAGGTSLPGQDQAPGGLSQPQQSVATGAVGSYVPVTVGGKRKMLGPDGNAVSMDVFSQMSDEQKGVQAGQAQDPMQASQPGVSAGAGTLTGGQGGVQAGGAGGGPAGAYPAWKPEGAVSGKWVGSDAPGEGGGFKWVEDQAQPGGQGGVQAGQVQDPFAGAPTVSSATEGEWGAVPGRPGMEGLRTEGGMRYRPVSDAAAGQAQDPTAGVSAGTGTLTGGTTPVFGSEQDISGGVDDSPMPWGTEVINQGGQQTQFSPDITTNVNVEAQRLPGTSFVPGQGYGQPGQYGRQLGTEERDITSQTPMDLGVQQEIVGGETPMALSDLTRRSTGQTPMMGAQAGVGSTIGGQGGLTGSTIGSMSPMAAPSGGLGGFGSFMAPPGQGRSAPGVVSPYSPVPNNPYATSAYMGGQGAMRANEWNQMAMRNPSLFTGVSPQQWQAQTPWGTQGAQVAQQLGMGDQGFAPSSSSTFMGDTPPREPGQTRDDKRAAKDAEKAAEQARKDLEDKYDIDTSQLSPEQRVYYEYQKAMDEHRLATQERQKRIEEVYGKLEGKSEALEAERREYSEGLEGRMGQREASNLARIAGLTGSERDRFLEQMTGERGGITERTGAMKGEEQERYRTLAARMRNMTEGQKKELLGQLAERREGIVGQYGQRETDIDKRFAGRLQKGLAMREGMGEEEKKEIRKRFADRLAQREGQSEQDLLGRGLGSTTIRSSVLGGIRSRSAREEEAALDRVTAEVRRGNVAAFQQMSGDQLVAAQNASMAKLQAGKELTGDEARALSAINQEIGARESQMGMAGAGALQGINRLAAGQQASLGAQGLAGTQALGAQGLGAGFGTMAAGMQGDAQRGLAEMSNRIAMGDRSAQTVQRFADFLERITNVPPDTNMMAQLMNQLGAGGYGYDGGGTMPVSMPGPQPPQPPQPQQPDPKPEPGDDGQPNCPPGWHVEGEGNNARCVKDVVEGDKEPVEGEPPVEGDKKPPLLPPPDLPPGPPGPPGPTQPGPTQPGPQKPVDKPDKPGPIEVPPQEPGPTPMPPKPPSPPVDLPQHPQHPGDPPGPNATQEEKDAYEAALMEYNNWVDSQEEEEHTAVEPAPPPGMPDPATRPARVGTHVGDREGGWYWDPSKGGWIPAPEWAAPPRGLTGR